MQETVHLCSILYAVLLGRALLSIKWVLLEMEARQWHPTPVLLPGKSHGRGSLEGCSPWGRGGSDTTEKLHFHFSLSCIGEGNGNPLQCSCLENPRDGGAWWAAVSCIQDLMFLSIGDRDLGLHSILTRGVRPHLKGKQRTPLSSRVATGISWSPLSGLCSVGEL